VPAAFVVGEIVHIVGLTSERGARLNGRSGQVVGDLSPTRAECIAADWAEHQRLPVLVYPAVKGERPQTIRLHLRNVRWALQGSYEGAMQVVRVAAGVPEPGDSPHLYVGARVRLRLPGAYDGCSGTIVADFLGEPRRFRVSVEQEEGGASRAVTVKVQNMSPVWWSGDSSDSLAIQQLAGQLPFIEDPRALRFMTALARSLLFPVFVTTGAAEVQDTDDGSVRPLRFGLGMVGVLEHDTSSARGASDPSTMKSIDPFTGIDPEQLAADGRDPERAGLLAAVLQQFRSGPSATNLRVECVDNRRWQFVDAPEHLDLIRYENQLQNFPMLDCCDDNADGSEPWDPRDTLQTARGRFVAVCLANTYEEHDNYPAMSQLCGADATLHALLATCFDLTIASVIMPITCTDDDFEFVNVDGEAIDKFGEDSPLVEPAAIFIDDNGDEFDLGGGLKSSGSILEELQRAKIRVQFKDLAAALDESESCGDEDSLCSIEWILDPNLEARDEIYALCMATHRCLGAASPARVLDKELLRVIAGFLTRGVRPQPWSRVRCVAAPSTVFLPMDGRENDARLVACEVEMNRQGSFHLTCHHRLSCLLVRLRPKGHIAYSTMRKVFGDAPLLGP
jgi:hypothetical protein